MNSSDSLQPQLVRPQLYIASVRTELYREVLEQNGITHILQVGVELTPSHPQHFTYLQLPVYDMPEQDIVSSFPAAFKFIDAGMSAGGGVLVHCQAGISRSATVVIAYCMWKERLSADAATAVVSAARSAVWPNLGFKCQLQEFEKLQWDASKWQGWDMSRFLSTRYGDESVNFMAAMLGGSPQDRVSMRQRSTERKLDKPAPQAAGMTDSLCDCPHATSSAACANAGESSSAAAAATEGGAAAAAGADIPGAQSAAGSCPSCPSCGADQQCAGHQNCKTQCTKAPTSSAAAGCRCGGGSCRQCCNVGTGSTRRVSYACYTSGNSSSNSLYGGISSRSRVRRHSTGQYVLAAVGTSAMQLGALQQLSLSRADSRLPEEAALLMAG